MKLGYRFSAKISAFLLLGLFAFQGASLHAQRKRKVAVLSFNLGDDANQRAKESLGIKADLGRDLSDKLVAKLVSDGKFTMVERSRLDQIIKEQNVQNSDRLDAQDAAKIGKIAGVDAIIIGSVSELSGSTKPVGLGGLLGGAGYFDNKVTVNVSVTARVIDTNTAVILASSTGSGSAMQEQKGMKGKTNTGAAYDTTGTSFGNSLMNDATAKAINMMAVQLEASPSLGDVPAAPRTTYQGTVADVSGSTIVFTVSTKNISKVGDVVEVSRVTRKIMDPDNPKVVLKVVHETVGKATVTEVDDSGLTSTVTATLTAAGSVKVKDEVLYKPAS